jgi:hypothetical protein
VSFGQPNRPLAERACFPAGEHQPSAEQAGVDGGQHGAAVSQPLLERAGRLQGGELGGVGLGLGRPGRGGRAERWGDVDLGDVDESGGAQ